MLRVADKWQGSDVGRQRQANEDNYFVQAPLFVLADGMGGALAGEVASEITIEAFRGGLPEGPVEDALVQTILRANAQVHDQATTVPEYHGMGTTCTVAYVAEEEVVIAHVGDSRAYLLRDGDLQRVTRDHSLVGELVDRGKVTEEEALTHPQRSVITRAVGPEPTVKVDADRLAGRAGDVYLLCSDGLTDMVREREVGRILVAVDDLEQAGRNLIAAANAAGGRDNITVILFRLESVQTAAQEEGVTSEHAAVSPDTATQPTTATAAVAVAEPATSAPPPRRTAPLPDSAPRTPAASGRKPPGRLRRSIKPLIVIGVLLAFVSVAAFIAIRGVFFIGLDENRSVTIYRGIPYEAPFGVDLYTRHYTSGVRIDQVAEARRPTFTERKWRSLDDVEDLVTQLEKGSVRE
ncbi:MAG: Stp1/IreP family PP2C-type Ser/Thr phosphatase [Solirubrobacteraceae bacterium]